MLLALGASTAQAEKYGVTGGCDCSASQTDSGSGYCSSNSVTYTSARGSSLTVTFDDPDGTGPEDDKYECGQYANGDVWVAGKSDGAGGNVVRVKSTTPDWVNTVNEGCSNCSEGKNGWMVDPTKTGEQHLDGRVSTNFTPPTSTEPLPKSYDVKAGYRSFIKDVGRPTSNPNHNHYWMVCNTGNKCSGAIPAPAARESTSLAMPRLQ